LFAEVLFQRGGRTRNRADETPVTLVLLRIGQPLAADNEKPHLRRVLRPQHDEEALHVGKTFWIGFAHPGPVEKENIAALDDLHLLSVLLSHGVLLRLSAMS
jgi:hypothetical protein